MDRLAVVRIVFFSGTGCTSYVADLFRRELEASGRTVQMHELRHGMTAPKEKYDHLILCFVVHAGNAPHPVMQWIESHSVVQSIPTTIISVSGAGEVTPNLACRVAIKRKFKKRGFSVEYEKMLVMPSNWIVPTPPCLAATLIEVLPYKIAYIVKDLVAGKRLKTKPGLVNRFLSILGRLEVYGAKEYGKKILVKDTCTGCGLCAKRCPVGNITLVDHKPIIGDQCIMCLNCLYQCPKHALHPGAGKFITIKAGFDLKKIQALVPWTKAIDIKAETRGLVWIGVRRYLMNRSDMLEPHVEKT